MTPTLESSMRGLAAANAVRIAGAQAKREIAAGTLSIADALTDPRCAAVPIGRLLASQWRWGEDRTERALRVIRVGSWRRTDSLTDRQRAVLAALIFSNRSTASFDDNQPEGDSSADRYPAGRHPAHPHPQHPGRRGPGGS